jgi:hypothetical protein
MDASTLSSAMAAAVAPPDSAELDGETAGFSSRNDVEELDVV